MNLPQPGPGLTSTERRRMQAFAFDHIGEHYDEVFPHKEGQLNAISWLIGRKYSEIV